MIDLHTHILPSVDDGPDTLAESVAMCRAAAAAGTTDLVATSHLRHAAWPTVGPALLADRFAELRAAVGEEPRLHLGAEIAVDSLLLDDLEAGELLPMAGGRWLLLELPVMPVGPSPRELVHELVVQGWRPLLAHVERIPGLGDRPDAVEELVALGARTQVTAASVTGHLGRPIQRRTFELLDAGLVHVVASDAHGVSRRHPNLRPARDLLTDRYGAAAAERLLVTNPTAIIENRQITD